MKMNAGDAVGRFFRRGFDFRGRSRRAEVWWTYLCVFAPMAVVTTMARPPFEHRTTWMWAMQGAGVLLLVPQIAQWVRRFHDRGLSAWWYAALVVAAHVGAGVAFFVLLAVGGGAHADHRWATSVGAPLLVVGAGGMVAAGTAILVIGALPGQAGANRFGPDPKRPSQASEDGP